MNRFIRSAIVLTVAVFVLAAPCIFAEEVVKFSNQFPASHFISKGMKFYADKVSELSNKNLRVRIFDSAQLFKDTEIVEALQNGLVQMGLVPVNQWSGMIPAADVFEIPFVFNDLSSPKKFLDAGASKLLDDAFQAKGAKVVFWVDYGLVQYFNNKRQLQKPEDFKGLKIRTFSKLTADTVTALGGTPAVLSSSEMYMALQRGTVDGATTGVPAAISRKLQEVQKHLTMANYATAQFVVQANLKWWNALSDADKSTLLKAGNEAEAVVRKSIERSENEALDKVKKAGVKIYYLTPAEKAAFMKATEQVRENFAKDTGKLGRQLVDIATGIK